MSVPKWLVRLMWKWKYRDCHRLAFQIATFGQGADNLAAQCHLDRAKDELYAAAHIFLEMSEK